jgi:hypothetical protein
VPLLSDLRGETRPLTVELDQPLPLRYHPHAFTPQVFDFLTLLDDPEAMDHLARREAMIGVLLQLLASWELYLTREDEEKRENALPVSKDILYRMTFDNMRTILSSIFEDLNPNPTRSESTDAGVLTDPSTAPRRKKAA